MQSSSWHSTSVFKGDKRFPGPANKRMQATANSVRSCLAPASGGADAARRQAAGAASYLAFPRRDQRRIRGRVTPRTDHRAIDGSPAPRRVTREQAWGDSRGERGTQWSPGALASQAGGLVEDAPAHPSQHAQHLRHAPARGAREHEGLQAGEPLLQVVQEGQGRTSPGEAGRRSRPGRREARRTPCRHGAPRGPRPGAVRHLSAE